MKSWKMLIFLSIFGVAIAYPVNKATGNTDKAQFKETKTELLNILDKKITFLTQSEILIENTKDCIEKAKDWNDLINCEKEAKREVKILEKKWKSN